MSDTTRKYRSMLVQFMLKESKKRTKTKHSLEKKIDELKATFKKSARLD